MAQGATLHQPDRGAGTKVGGPKAPRTTLIGFTAAMNVGVKCSPETLNGLTTDPG